MRQNHSRCLPLLIGIILLLSLLGYLVNYFIYNYTGNNYFPKNPLFLALLLLLMYQGFALIYGNNSYPAKSAKEMIYFLSVMSLIALATNVVQLTPFASVDSYIVRFETGLGINLVTILEWTMRHPLFKEILVVIYDTLPYQMSLLPLLLILLGRTDRIRDYYFLLLLTTLFGFTVYYFFPTAAPASILTSPLFSPEELATGIKFMQIHHHQTVTTNEGGLIALPSFHSIWALLCVFLLKEWIIPCSLLLVINLLLIASCVLLGWHYLSDVVLACLIVGLALHCLRLCKKRLDQSLN